MSIFGQSVVQSHGDNKMDLIKIMSIYISTHGCFFHVILCIFIKYNNALKIKKSFNLILVLDRHSENYDMKTMGNKISITKARKLQKTFCILSNTFIVAIHVKAIGWSYSTQPMYLNQIFL